MAHAEKKYGVQCRYVAGRERTRSRIREVTDDLVQVQNDLRKVADQVASQNVQLAAINANLEWLKRNAERG